MGLFDKARVVAKSPGYLRVELARLDRSPAVKSELEDSVAAHPGVTRRPSRWQWPRCRKACRRWQLRRWRARIRRMRDHNVLIRHLHAMETVGATKCVCCATSLMRTTRCPIRRYRARPPKTR